MPSTTSLTKKLEADFSALIFKQGDDFRWSHATYTITYDPASAVFEQQLLHELAHAILAHHTYARDIDLIAMERDAWTYARETLSVRYSVTIDEENTQNALDSYRDWMHARSTCPECGATGLESKKSTYSCPSCGEQWQVNEARICGLKRYRIKK